jgi:hypothetical protein
MTVAITVLVACSLIDNCNHADERYASPRDMLQGMSGGHLVNHLAELLRGQLVGWVERSDTHQSQFAKLMGFAKGSTHPTLREGIDGPRLASLEVGSRHIKPVWQRHQPETARLRPPLGLRDERRSVIGMANDLDDVRDLTRTWVVLGPSTAALSQSNCGIGRQGIEADPVPLQDAARSVLKFLDHAVRPRVDRCNVVTIEQRPIGRLIGRFHPCGEQQRNPAGAIDDRRIGIQSARFDTALVSHSPGKVIDETPHRRTRGIKPW